MNITFSFNELLLYQIALFSMLSPFAVIGPFAAITDGYSRKAQRKIALHVSLSFGLILILLSLLGNAVLLVLGISLESLSAAGGLILIVSSMNMVLKGDSPRRKPKPGEMEDDEDWHSVVVAPLLFPVTLGAGTLSLVLTETGYAVTVMDKILLCVVIIIHSAILFVVYFFSGSLSERIGNKGNAVLTRVGGIILLSIAFTVFARGLKVLLPGLAG